MERKNTREKERGGGGWGKGDTDREGGRERDKEGERERESTDVLVCNAGRGGWCPPERYCYDQMEPITLRVSKRRAASSDNGQGSEL